MAVKGDKRADSARERTEFNATTNLQTVTSVDSHFSISPRVPIWLLRDTIQYFADSEDPEPSLQIIKIEDV